ncbi:MAG: tetratricopeptide repeat protein [Deltaproteobacteria bacterium]|nr:tetratricopeptide repeat protein [Deltaproteobacteria bacterium]
MHQTQRCIVIAKRIGRFAVFFLWMLALVTLVSCGATPAIVPERLQQSQALAAQNEIRQFWSDATSVEVRIAFQQLNGKWPRAVGERFVLRMNELTDEWVKQYAATCDSEARSASAVEVCDGAVRSCFQFTLHKQKAIVAVARRIESSGLDVLDGTIDMIWVEIQSCTRSAVIQSHDAADSDELSQLARKYLAEAQLYQMLLDERYESMLAKADAVAQKSASRNVKVEVGLSVAWNLLLKNQQTEALTRIEKLSALATERQLKIAMAYIDLLKGHGWFAQEKYKEAVASYREALTQLQSLMGMASLPVAVTYSVIGQAYSQMTEPVEAVKVRRKARDLFLKGLGKTSMYYAYENMLLAESLSDAGQNEDALKIYEDALASFVAMYGLENPYAASVYSNMGTAYFMMGQNQRSIDMTENALDIQLALYGAHHWQVAISYANLAVQYDVLGDHDQEASLYKKALDIFIAVFGEQDDHTADTYHSLGMAYKKLESFPLALQNFQKALETRTSAEGEGSVKAGETVYQIRHLCDYHSYAPACNGDSEELTEPPNM